MRIRKFKMKDLAPVLHLTNKTFKESYPASLFIDYHCSWSRGFLVAVEKKLLGYVLGIKMSRIKARILILCVEEEYRRRGIGTALLHAFINSCIGAGINEITLEVRESNLPAIKFYQKFDFSIVGFIPSYYADGENGYVMHWEQGKSVEKYLFR